ncbi:MAG: CapA family protein [Deltaproteobacteria bacterium]|nr:CapA family protein [Deltaproteobacteria bacterium]
MAERSLTMLATGDLVLDMPDAESFFTHVTPVLKAADVVVGQGEVVFTARGNPSFADHPAPPCDPKNMGALHTAGFHVITLAGNHVFDSGAPGIEDTVEGLKNYGIATVGAGMNIDEARRPVIIEREGTRFGFLSYNCVGPMESWASPDKAGCAYVHIVTHYELDHANPGGPPTIYSFAEPRSLGAMVDDIQRLRAQCDVLVVALHKGLVHTPIKLAMYEQPLCYAALDAGADIILGHHSHILHGIEMYKGKPIFHGLCNLVTVTKVLTMEGADTAARKEWAKRRKELFGFEPDPEYPKYPFHPEAKHTIIATCTIDKGKISRVGYLPCLINKQAQPEVCKRDKKGQQVFDYVDKITKAAGLNARYEWEGDEVTISAE